MRSFLRAVIGASALALSACAPLTAPTSPNAEMRVLRDRGGYYHERLEHIARLEEAGTPVAIQGLCQSACTLFLALPNACVYPQARLGFHGPQGVRNGRVFEVPEPERSQVVDDIAAHYPPAIATWFRQHAAHLSGNRYAWMRGREAMALGIPACRPRTSPH